MRLRHVKGLENSSMLERVGCSLHLCRRCPTEGTGGGEGGADVQAGPWREERVPLSDSSAQRGLLF